MRSTILLGKILLEREIITSEQLDSALKEQQGRGGFLGTILVKLGFITEEKLLPVLSEQLGVPYVRLKNLKIEHEILEKVPARFASHYKLIPIKLDGKTLSVAVTDPTDLRTLDDLRLILGYDIQPVLAGESDIIDGIKRNYGVGASTLEALEQSLDTGADTSIVQPDDTADELAEDASVIKLVNQLILQAFQDRATDIHIEPYQDELKVRFRIDGVLYPTNVPPAIRHFKSAIVSRIKIMARLDIAERRLPQDGRIKINVAGKDLDLRVSILPTPFGEAVDIRILPPNLLYSLEELGLSQRDIYILESMIKKPHGIILVTGPTGSGKTTTLYACLNKINDAHKKILTIEDPIEYLLKGVTQIQVNPKIGLSFAQGLRSMLRHNPDVMMVGEIRDIETSEIAIRVALTGHLVFSTLHTNDASGAVTRLLDMGIEPYLCSSSVICFIAQRLVRLICPDCRISFKAGKELLKDVGQEVDLSSMELFEGKGCQQCRFTGYRGRTAIYELLVVDDNIRELVLKRAPSLEIKKLAIKNGMRTLRRDGFDKVAKGLTTVQEVIRVTIQEEDACHS